jgi:galactokinase
MGRNFAKSVAEVFNEIETEFIKRFGTSKEKPRWFFAPGRVNLIGEHIDYCGGNVLPATIEMGTFAVARENRTDTIRVNSTLIPWSVSFTADAISYKKEDDWGNYPKGVFLEYIKSGAFIPGLDILYHSDLPGGGLSRSASLEICTAILIEAFSGYRLDADPRMNRKKMALLCQHAENHFIGVNCGIMDQAAIALGKPGKITFLNCATLDVDYIPVHWSDYRLMIIDSNKSRKLVESSYNECLEDVGRALTIIQKRYPVKNLCDLSMAQLPEVLSLLCDTRLKKRVRHVISENHRTSLAYEALKSGKLEEFGKALNASHISLRDDYEVTGKELDCLFDISRRFPGVLGARMTGAGFGGCFIALVQKDRVDMYKTAFGKEYQKIIGYPPTCYPVSIGVEPGEIKKE